jgi:uncharacterized lipoprotein YmbA
MNRAALGLAAALALGACAHSTPTRFFTLDAVAPARPTPVAATSPVQLDAVHIPPELDRPQVVTSMGANRLAVHDLDQWASPLGEMMRRTLAQDLLARIPQGGFVLPDAPRAAGVRGLVVDVLLLRADPGGQVTMQASWTLMTPGTNTAVIVRNVQLGAAGAPGPEGEAAATSQILGQLADQIASSLGQG